MITANQVLEALMSEVASNSGLISVNGEDYGFVREIDGGWALYKDPTESFPDTEIRQSVTLTLGAEREHSVF